MSTAQRRRPFESINANTLKSGFGKKTAGAASHQGAVQPVKAEKKRGGLLSRSNLFTSILTTAKKTNRKESGVDETSNLESPTKKARANSSDKSYQITSLADAVDHNAEIFRQSNLEEAKAGNFWTVEMEDLLSLKPSRPINESRDDTDEASRDVQIDESEERDDVDFYEQVRTSLAKELDVVDASSSEHTMCLSRGHLVEHETEGLTIAFRE